MSSPWEVFGCEEVDAAPAPQEEPADVCGSAHPFFASRLLGESSLDEAVAALESSARALAADCAASLRAACHDQAAALLLSTVPEVDHQVELFTMSTAMSASAFCAHALAVLETSGWQLPAWGTAHALCRCRLAAHALAASSPAQSLRHADEALLAASRASEDGSVGPQQLRRALGAVLHAASAALPPLAPFSCVFPVLEDIRSPHSLPGAPAAAPVPRASYDATSLRTFLQRHVVPGQPLLLENCAAKWPALSRWRDLGQLCSRYGHRTLPVELSGGAQCAVHAAAPTAMQHMMLLELVQRHLAPNIASGGASCDATLTAYVSQHGLLTQLSGLSDDILVPRLASYTPLRACNAWLGSAGTVTHLHTDEAHNILVQVCGTKLVRLYLPSEGLAHALRATPHPRAAPDALLNQFSDVHAEAPDARARAALQAFPPPLEVLLSPGDALFIPKGCWHYVRSLTPALSVNFWW